MGSVKKIFLKSTILLGLATATVFMACVGDGVGVDDQGLTFDPCASEYDKVQAIFNNKCTTCHGSAKSGELELSAGKSYKSLVGINAAGISTETRVKKGDSKNSYLIKKLEGTEGIVGDKMPKNATPLTKAEIQIIKDWIDAGAEAPVSSCDTTKPVIIPPETTVVVPSFFTDSIQPILKKCAGCHGGKKPAGGMSLKTDDAYTNLLDSATTDTLAKMKRVTKGDLNASFLYLKISMDSPPGKTGDRMPQGGKLTPAQTALIGKWILMGAPGPLDSLTTGLPALPTNFFRDSINPGFEDNGCTRCHSDGGEGWDLTGGANNGLILDDADSALKYLVNIPAFGDTATIPKMSRVTPNDPINSALYRKISAATDKEIFGEQMPPGGGAEVAFISKVYRWISAGAPTN